MDAFMRREDWTKFVKRGYGSSARRVRFERDVEAKPLALAPAAP